MGSDEDRGREIDQLAYWIYAVVRPWNDRGSEAPPCTGITAAPVHALPHRDLAAIVSPVSLDEFGPQALAANLRDATWVTVNVLAHQQVLAWLLGRYTVAPFRFGNYCSVERVRETLNCHYQNFAETLSRVERATEWGVKLYCDREAMAERVRTTNVHVQRLDEEAGRKPEGAVYLLRKRRERLVQMEVECLLEAHSCHSYQQLAGRASEAVTNPVRPRSVPGTGGEMILNASYLVADVNLQGFRAAVTALEEIAAPLGLTYELTGPWPPYSFVNMVLEDLSANAPRG